MGSPFYLDLIGVIELQTKPPQQHLLTEGVFIVRDGEERILFGSPSALRRVIRYHHHAWRESDVVLPRHAGCLDNRKAAVQNSLQQLLHR